MKLLSVLGIVIIIIGVIVASFSLIFSHEETYKTNNSIILGPYSRYSVPYLSDSEIIFTYNSTLPVNVSGYPSSATLLNNSVLYTICFFSSKEGNLSLYNPYNSTSVFQYILEEATMKDVFVEYGFIAGLIITGSGIFITIYALATKKK
ncbi:hypothetical protein [Acidianus brierleyi]|uniref:Uncharacterized protein n=1 Tax=Acidianus brierleyi TaxID=41673 RepID=A0A2U9ICB2_9CREN|nr:hypothetical protein [Acidianus brierleyi]AWR93630.1 hypothetical protein DFR85_02390 [Acidianus brierleyi]